MANSRVGDNTNIRGKRLLDATGFFAIDERAGMLNARVFPLPVSAIPTMSLFLCIKIGHDWAWIGEGFSNPFASVHCRIKESSIMDLQAAKVVNGEYAPSALIFFVSSLPSSSSLACFKTILLSFLQLSIESNDLSGDEPDSVFSLTRAFFEGTTASESELSLFVFFDNETSFPSTQNLLFFVINFFAFLKFSLSPNFSATNFAKSLSFIEPESCFFRIFLAAFTTLSSSMVRVRCQLFTYDVDSLPL
mmetsp:Transcript_23767/g.55963  ORF Transcript_23767/g.55963 Transcript_23767/m.55963 type:complete len:248 (-) Transcript_23767:13-756(-)